MNKFEMPLLNEIIDPTKITRVNLNNLFVAEFSFADVSFGELKVNTLKMKYCSDENIFAVKYGYKRTTMFKRNARSKRLSPYEFLKLLDVLQISIPQISNATVYPLDEKDHICAIVPPKRISKILMSVYLRYTTLLKQKVSILCERLIREHNINYFVLPIKYFLGIATAQILIELRSRYPFLHLEFVDYFSNSTSFEIEMKKMERAADLFVKNKNYRLPTIVQKGYLGNKHKDPYIYDGLYRCDIAIIEQDYKKNYFDAIDFCQKLKKEIVFINNK